MVDFWVECYNKILEFDWLDFRRQNYQYTRLLYYSTNKEFHLLFYYLPKVSSLLLFLVITYLIELVN